MREPSATYGKSAEMTRSSDAIDDGGRSRGRKAAEPQPLIMLDPSPSGSAERAAGSRYVMVAVVAWNFVSSTLLTNFVKLLYTRCNFNFPLFVAACHMSLSWLAAAIVVQRRASLKDAKPLLTSSERMRRVLPFSVLNAGSLACANTALTMIYPSFHEMIQSTTPLATLVISILLQGKRWNAWAFLSMLPLCSGTAFSTAFEINFSAVGLTLSAMAVWTRSLKTVAQAYLLNEVDVDSVTLCYYMAPFNLVIFSLGSLALEGHAPLDRLLGGHETDASIALTVALLISSSLLACSFTISGYLLLRYVDAVSFTVIANVKTPCIIVVSLFMFRNPVRFAQIMGFGLTFFGAWLFSQKAAAL